MDARCLLDEDSWREVLDRVNDPADLKACSETCLIFEMILSEKRNAFLFDSILPMIMKYLPSIKHVTEEKTSWMVLLDCRLVCRNWCKSVDKLAGSSSFGSLFEYEYCFASEQRIERFLQTFGTHGGNPIIGGNVAIVHHGYLLEDKDLFPRQTFHITKIFQLLSRFGNEIRTLKLVEGVRNHIALCKNLQKMLCQTPNLRILQLTGDWFIIGDNLEEVGQEGNMNELSAYITANPFPPLPHLECLEIPGLSLVMTKSLLKEYSSQLKDLTLNLHPARFLEELPRFSCLKELALQYLDTSAPLDCLRELHSPLTKLRLIVTQDSDRLIVFVWPIDELFRNIQHLPIQKLEIINWSNLFLGESASMSPELRVHLESISSVHITCADDTVSLNLLAYCPNLEVLHLSHGGPRRFSKGHPNGVPELFDVTSLIKDDGYDLYQSNIWGAIPSLKKFTLGYFGYGCRGTQYHRKTYEEKKLENKKETGLS